MALPIDELNIGDIYQKKDGKRFVVSVMCREPTVHMTEIEPNMDTNPHKVIAGISGKLWDGFTKI
jgi:hypothetical protein